MSGASVTASNLGSQHRAKPGIALQPAGITDAACITAAPLRGSRALPSEDALLDPIWGPKVGWPHGLTLVRGGPEAERDPDDENEP
jgi:hypothetical protein